MISGKNGKSGWKRKKVTSGKPEKTCSIARASIEAPFNLSMLKELRR